MREGFHLFEKRLFLYLFLILQLALSALILQYNVAVTESLTENYRLIRPMEAVHGVWLYAHTGANIPGAQIEETLDLSGLQGEYELAEGAQYYFTIDNPAGMKTAKVCSYNGLMLQKLRAPLSCGSWDSGCREENGVTQYPIIVNSQRGGLSLGDVTVLRKGQWEIPVYVAGVLDAGGKYISLSGGSNQPIAEQMVAGCENDGLYAFFNSDLYPEEIVQARFMTCAQRLLYFSPSLSEETYADNLQCLKNIGWVSETSEVIENTEANLRETMRFYLPLYIATLLVSVAGLLSFSLLVVYQNLRYHAILLLSGASRRDCIGISVASFAYMALGAVLFFFLFLLVAHLLYAMPFSALSLLVAAAACVGAVLPGAVLPLLYLCRHRVAYLMHEIL